jgi:alginate lyase
MLQRKLLVVGLLSVATGLAHGSSNYQCFETTGPSGFVHPGIIHGCTDLNRMRDKVAANASPWYDGYLVLKSDSYSRTNYVANPAENVPWNSNNEPYRLERDGTAAYQQAVLWYVTGNDTYRTNALSIVRAWSEMTGMYDYIRGGPGMLYLTTAAEILRNVSNSGWTDQDTQAYGAMLTRIESAGLGLDNDALFQNQGALAAEGLQAIAVFSDNKTYWNKVIQRNTVGTNPVEGRDYALARSTLPSGQVAEMGRDQAHPSGTLRAYAQMAQTMYLQRQLGDAPLFDYLSQRLRANFEYWTQYNLGADTDWVPHVVSTTQNYTYAETYNSISTSNRGLGYGNMLSGAYYYYLGIDSLPASSMPNTKMFMKLQGADQGWLLYARDSVELPGQIKNGQGGYYSAILSGRASQGVGPNGEVTGELTASTQVAYRDQQIPGSGGYLYVKARTRNASGTAVELRAATKDGSVLASGMLPYTSDNGYQDIYLSVTGSITHLMFLSTTADISIVQIGFTASKP